ncbi:hypothetical protein PHMEG_00034797 [Phytophthora megakarya]|uniref:Uncharacterized protein n=1 Tax=Phytophthora megakarya TaxID=4795 RepID=A0A225UQA0_9STRA|nr:hypothetical protein PHMEG_00034797 [Phytophthora megakarya]
MELALAMSTVANGRVHFFDKKKVTRKSSSLRKRWRLLRMTHPDVSSGSVVGDCTLVSRQCTALDLV